MRLVREEARDDRGDRGEGVARRTVGSGGGIDGSTSTFICARYGRASRQLGRAASSAARGGRTRACASRAGAWGATGARAWSSAPWAAAAGSAARPRPSSARDGRASRQLGRGARVRVGRGQGHRGRQGRERGAGAPWAVAGLDRRLDLDHPRPSSARDGRVSRHQPGSGGRARRTWSRMCLQGLESGACSEGRAIWGRQANAAEAGTEAHANARGFARAEVAWQEVSDARAAACAYQEVSLDDVVLVDADDHRRHQRRQLDAFLRGGGQRRAGEHRPVSTRRGGEEGRGDGGREGVAGPPAWPGRRPWPPALARCIFEGGHCLNAGTFKAASTPRVGRETAKARTAKGDDDDR